MTNISTNIKYKVVPKSTKDFNNVLYRLKLAEKEYKRTRLRIIHEHNFEMLPYNMKKAQPHLKELTSRNWKYVKEFPKLLEELKDMMSNRRIRPRRTGLTQALILSITNIIEKNQTVLILTQDIEGTINQVKHIPNINIERVDNGILLSNKNSHE